MKKRILSIVLTLCIVFMLVPISANAMSINVNLSIVGAADLNLEVESGDSIENVKKKIEAQTGYPKTDQILKYDYDHDYDDDVLDDTKTLADYSIQKDDTIVLSLVGASTGTTSKGLKYTIYGGKVTITGYDDDLSRTTVTIPNTIGGKPVTAIGERAFANCRYLESITIPSSVTSIGNGAFDSCDQLKSVTFGENSQLKSIGDFAFFRCEFTSINIPGSVTAIGERAFASCPYLESITIPSSVTSIGRGAFRCGGLTGITVEPNNSNYSSADGVLFNKDKTELVHYPAGNTRTSYSIPGSVKTIGSDAFMLCNNLESVTFGENSQLESIGADAFYSCNGLESINIPNSVTSIGEDAFHDCSNLESIIIPNNVTVINDRTFSYCNNLESIFLSDKVSSIGTAAIPDTTSQVKYSLDTNKGEVTITEINLGTDKTSVTIPAAICGYPVVAVADNYQTLVGTHTCAGGNATCQSKATCGICGKEYGEIDSTNHSLEKIPAKAATVTETGNKEYWHCKDCDKFFSDANGESEIIDLAAWKTGEGKLAKLPPEIINGKGQSITAGEKKELTFRSNADFSDFIRVELDGKTLDAKYYTAKEGSTIITLKADYVASLSAGEHTIGIVSKSGTATTEFTVNVQTASGNNSPETGDNSNFLLWIALLFVSGAGVTGATVYSKRKNMLNK